MPNIKKYELLVVDDDKIMQMVYQVIFKPPFRATVVGSALEAISLLKKKNFDAVITDINMPEMSGIELAKLIRTLESSDKNSVLILGVTAMPEHETKKALVAGMNKVFIKPATIEEITKYLNSIFVKNNPAYGEAIC